MTVATTSADPLHTAIRYLADRSEREPGTGFLASDLAFGRRIAWLPARAWTPEIRHQAWRIAGKYATLLGGIGIDLAQIPEPPKPLPARAATTPAAPPAGGVREIDAGNGVFVIRFPYSAGLVARCKAVPGHRYVYQGKWWTIPKAGAWFVKQLVQQDGFTITPAAEAMVATAPARSGWNRSPIPDTPRGRAITMGPDGVPRLTFGPHQVVLEIVRAIAGARYQEKGKDGPYWRVPASPEAVPRLLELVDRYGFACPPEYRRVLEEIAHEAEALVTASKAAAAELVIPGLRGELRPFQRAGVVYLARAKRAWLADEMGLGKTPQALATLQYTSAWPALVVVPASVKLNWEREARRWLPGRDVIVLNGKPLAEKIDLFAGKALFIVNYDLLERYVDLDEKSGKPKPLQRLGLRALVLDESQYVKNPKAKRTKACRILAKTCEYRLLLTGTPILNRPEELLSQLTILGRLDELGGYRHFKTEYIYGDKHDVLHRALRSRCYIRRTKAEVMPELPPVQQTTVPLELDNREEYDRVAADVVKWLREQAEQDDTFRASIAHLPLGEQAERTKERGAEVASRARAAEQLVRIGALKRCAARGKLRAAVSWIRDFLASDQKLIFFVWHHDVLDAVVEQLNGGSHRQDVREVDGSRAGSTAALQGASQEDVGVSVPLRDGESGRAGVARRQDIDGLSGVPPEEARAGVRPGVSSLHSGQGAGEAGGHAVHAPMAGRGGPGALPGLGDPAGPRQGLPHAGRAVAGPHRPGEGLHAREHVGHQLAGERDQAQCDAGRAEDAGRRARGPLAVQIDGRTSLSDRQAAVDRFQNDPACRLAVVNLQAGGVGLTMTAASNVAFMELGWNPATHDQAIARCYGRVNDAHGATAWYLLAAGTIDEDIISLIDDKRKVVDQVTDGAAPEESTSILRDLVAKLTGRAPSLAEAPVDEPPKRQPPVLAW